MPRSKPGEYSKDVPARSKEIVPAESRMSQPAAHVAIPDVTLIIRDLVKLQSEERYKRQVKKMQLLLKSTETLAEMGGKFIKYVEKDKAWEASITPKDFATY